MVYLTLMVSTLPVVPTLTPDQKVYMRFEQSVPDELTELSADDVKDYFISVREVIMEDLKERKLKQEAAEASAATSTPPLALEGEETGSG